MIMLINVLLPSEYKRFTYTVVGCYVALTIGGSRGHSQFNFYQFHAVFGKKMAKIIDWHAHLGAIPVWEILDPPLLTAKTAVN